MGSIRSILSEARKEEANSMKAWTEREKAIFMIGTSLYEWIMDAKEHGLNLSFSAIGDPVRIEIDDEDGCQDETIEPFLVEEFETHRDCMDAFFKWYKEAKK